MVCIYCEAPTRVINSRAQKRLRQTWRRRECQRCHALFTTHEGADYSMALRLEDEGQHLHEFNRDELFVSVHTALSHRIDSVTAANALTATIITKLLKSAQNAKITRSDVITIASETLQAFDYAASVAYSARHH